MIDAELAERLKRSVGLRNVLTHDYVAVDLAVVAATVDVAREDYGAYVRQLSRWLAERAR